jgi:hypothetical protein
VCWIATVFSTVTPTMAVDRRRDWKRSALISFSLCVCTFVGAMKQYRWKSASEIVCVLTYEQEEGVEEVEGEEE